MLKDGRANNYQQHI